MEHYYGTDHVFTSRSKNKLINMRSGQDKILNFKNSISFNGSSQIIYSLNDLPNAELGVITLEDNKLYIFVGTVDLLGARLLGGNVSIIEGLSSENSFLTSTGLPLGTALISSEFTIIINSISIIDVDTALNLNGQNNDRVIDWRACNFGNVPNVGTIKNYNNFIYESGAFLNCTGLIFDGNFGTIAIINSIYTNFSNGTSITIADTCVISRRFKIIESSMVTSGTGISVNFSNTATIANQGYILTSCSFSGGTLTTLVGVQASGNKSLFFKNEGISNSRSSGSLYINASTATTVVLNTWTKILGTSTPNPLNEEFSHLNNRLTYLGNLEQIFNISFSASITGSPGRDFEIGISKNGEDPLENTVAQNTADSGGKAKNTSAQSFIGLAQNDYLEVFIKNTTDSTNLTAVRMILTVTGLF